MRCSSMAGPDSTTRTPCPPPPTLETVCLSVSGSPTWDSTRDARPRGSKRGGPSASAS